MMADPAPQTRRRITVMLSSTGSLGELLDSLTPLVEAELTDLTGLFVEEAELLALASLPFSQELNLLTHTQRNLDPAEVERQWRIRARSARRVMEATAARASVRCHFESVRGTFPSLVQQVLREVDLLAIGPQRQVAATGLATTQSARRPVLAVWQSEDSSPRVLRVAARVAAHRQCPLSVLLSDAVRDTAASLQSRLQQHLGNSPVNVQSLAEGSVEAVLEAARRARAGTLVMAAEESLLSPEDMTVLRQQLECTALLVR